MKILLDSTALIDILRGDAAALSRTEQLRLEGAVFYTTTLNLYEVFCGLAHVKKQAKQSEEAFSLLSSSLTILPFDAEAARQAANIYFHLRAIGKPVDGLDYLIAGTAASNNMDALLTRNQKHFTSISQIKQVIGY